MQLSHSSPLLGFVKENFCSNLHSLKSFHSRRSSGCGGVDVREVFLGLRDILAAWAFKMIPSASVSYVDVDEVLAVFVDQGALPRHRIVVRAYS